MKKITRNSILAKNPKYHIFGSFYQNSNLGSTCEFYKINTKSHHFELKWMSESKSQKTGFSDFEKIFVRKH